MGVKSLLQIQSPEESTLQVWKAHADSLALLKLLQENPDAVDDVVSRIASAYKLTQDEKDARQQAIDDVNKAQSDLDALQLQHGAVKDEADQFMRRAEVAAKKMLDDANKIKKEQELTVQKRFDDLEEYKKGLEYREDTITDRENACMNLAADKKSLEKAKKDFEAEKAEWQKDFSLRLESLSAREQARLKA